VSSFKRWTTATKAVRYPADLKEIQIKQKLEKSEHRILSEADGNMGLDEERVVETAINLHSLLAELQAEPHGEIGLDVTTVIAGVKHAVAREKHEVCHHNSCAYFEDTWGDGGAGSPGRVAAGRGGVAAYYPKVEQAAPRRVPRQPYDPFAASVHKDLSAGIRSRPIPGINPAKRQHNPTEWYPQWLREGYKQKKKNGNKRIEEEICEDNFRLIRGGEGSVQVHNVKNDPELWRNAMKRHLANSHLWREKDATSKCGSEKKIDTNGTARPLSSVIEETEPGKAHWVRRSTRLRNK